MARTLVLFDFDGTITKSDTLFLITKRTVSKIGYAVGLFVLSPILVLNKLGLISSHTTKEIFLTWFFNNKPTTVFNDFAALIDVRPKALEQIKEHQRLGHRVVVVSASSESWIGEWAKQNNLELVATRLEIKNNLLTGKIEGLNCNGAEKVNRIKSYLQLNEYDEIIVYGDSKGDREMLALGTKTFYKPFRD